MAGYAEHGSTTGAASIVWLVPVVIGVIHIQQRKEAINKKYEKYKDRHNQKQKETFLNEIKKSA